jgi:glycosyltransferase involved in cell wall biosynthesis
LFFSIIIPTFNRANYLFRTIDSIKIQNFKDYEIIIIDDFSEDDTIKLLDLYIKDNNSINIKIYKLSTNSGPNVARNIGSKISNGKYLIFLDSDDEFYSLNSLSEIYDTIVNEKFPKILMFSSYYLKENKIINLSFDYLDYKGFLNSKNNGEFLPVVEAIIFKDILFPISIRGGEGITWLSISKLDNKVVYSSKVVRLYNNVEENRLSTFSPLYCKRLYDVYILYFNTFWLDLLKYNIIGFFKILIRIIYYKLATNKLLYLLLIKFKKITNE